MPTPAPAPVPGVPSCAIVALSDDPLLLEALTGAATESSSVSSSPSTDRFIDQLVANGAGIALIDAANVATPLKNFLATLREQFPQLLLLLTGPAQLQAQFGAQIADGTIFRFVHKPASSQRLRLFIDAAMRQLAAPVAGPAPRAIVFPVRPAGPQRPTGGRRAQAIAGISGAVLAAVAIAWMIWQHASAPAPAPASSEKPPLAEQVTQPNQAPLGAAQPQELSATDAQIVRDTAAREAAVRDAAALEQAQRSAQGARADQLAVYVQLARKRLTSGALIEPTDDSARAYLDSAIALAPEDTEVRATKLAFGEALIAQFRHAIAAGDAVEAQRWLTACSSFHVGSTMLSQLTAQLQQLQSAQQSRSEAGAATAVPSAATGAAASVATTTLATPAPTVPAASSSGAAATAADPAAVTPTVINEGSLTRVLFVPPTYPEEANARGIVGWVDLEFTVTTEGRVTDVTVTTSEPANVFDRAARSAILRNRYRPVLRDGVPVAQRARIRVRFKQ